MFCARISILICLLPSAAQAAYQFEAYNFARNDMRTSNSLKVEMLGRGALRSFSFVGRVGGVNFETKIDIPDSADVDLIYDAGLADGARAIIRIDDESGVIPLYDWQLIPIVEYADSPYTAVVSIFGDGPDPENKFYIDYHAAFENTHLGARLLQADILLLDPMTFSQAPMENGESVYYPGEASQAQEDERMFLAATVADFMRSIDYQSWVITDTERLPRLLFEDGEARVEIEPYVYFWRSEPTQDAAEAELQLQEASARAQAVQMAARQKIEEYDALYIEYLAAAAGSEKEAQLLSSLGTLAASISAQEIEFVALLEDMERVAASMPEPSVLEVEDATRELAARRKDLEALAPFVFDAVDATAGYAALFRGLKENHPDEWREFKAAVSSTPLAPVETPNEFDR